MKHTPIVQVSCDTCGDTADIDLSWKYRSMSESSGYWSEDDVNAELKSYEWIIENEGEDDNENHFCCEDCQKAAL